MSIDWESNCCNRPNASFATKAFSISRHVIFTVLIVGTLAAFGYSIFIYVDCNDDVRGKDCAIGRGKDICSSSLNPMVGLSCTIFIVGFMLVGCKYSWTLYSLGLSVIFELIYLVIILTTESANSLTYRSEEVVFREMQRCPLTSNASRTSDSECWEMFRTEYCHGWILGENRICQPFSYDCEFSINQTGICYDESFLQFYYNLTPYELVRDCVNSYEPLVVGAYNYHSKIANDLFINITVLHVALWLALGFAVYMFKKFKKNDPNVDRPDISQVTVSYRAENSNTSSGVSSLGDRYVTDYS